MHRHNIGKIKRRQQKTRMTRTPKKTLNRFWNYFQATFRPSLWVADICFTDVPPTEQKQAHPLPFVHLKFNVPKVLKSLQYDLIFGINNVSLYIYIHIYMNIYIYIHIYNVYIYFWNFKNLNILWFPVDFSGFPTFDTIASWLVWGAQVWRDGDAESGRGVWISWGNMEYHGISWNILWYIMGSLYIWWNLKGNQHDDH
jgi:hypothetical protein